MDEVTKLRKENEKLKQQIQKGRDFMRFNAKISDLIFLIIVSVAYFSSVHFLAGLSSSGAMILLETMSPELALFFWLSSIMILYIAGIFYTLTTLFNIFEEEVERFVIWLKVTLFPGKKSKKSTQKKTKTNTQARTPDGKFAPKNG